MIYGRSYEGMTRECKSCAHFTNVHSLCASCETAICENCSLHGDCHHDFCSESCHQKACEHENIRYECIEDVDSCCGYRAEIETWTCRDCGVEIDHNGEVIYTTQKRKAA